MQQEWIEALVGGGLIGAASVLLLAVNGRIFGVSGIVGGVTTPRPGDTSWRLATIVGLVAGGLALRFLHPSAFDAASARSLELIVAAGLLVGFGTRLGNGCTSGHGICGVSRLSKRSIAATATFLAAGMLTATLVGRLGGTP